MISALEKKHRATEGIRILRGGLGPLKFKEGRSGGFPVIDIFEQRFILMSVLSHKDVSEEPSGIRRNTGSRGKPTCCALRTARRPVVQRDLQVNGRSEKRWGRMA